MYRRLGDADAEELAAMKDELADRFGALPQEVLLFLKAMGLRILGQELGIKSIRVGASGTQITFHAGKPHNPEALIAWIATQKIVKPRPNNSLMIATTWEEDEDLLGGLAAILGEIKGVFASDEGGAVGAR